MIDIKLLRENLKGVKASLKKKNFDVKIIDDLLKLDKEWRALITKINEARGRQKKLSGDIPRARVLKIKIKGWSEKLAEIDKKREVLLESIPNLPSDRAPVGKSEKDNVVVREVGKKPNFKFKPKDYLELAENLDIIDVKRAAKVAGSRFGYLKGDAALWEIALIQFAFEQITKEGFTSIIPPVMIKPDVFRGMGRLAPGEEDERYYLPKDDLYLVASAEHTLGPLHKDEVLNENELPKRYVGFSTCFRREAGSYGKDTKGILRVHQFDKVEMFSFCRPEDSEKELQKLVSIQEKLMKLLKLPYRLVEIATGDMGWTDAHAYDIETWLPGQGQYRETHSASNTTDFQARGINARFKRRGGETEFIHMLNATGLAMGRIIIAIIENYQKRDGTINVPSILKHRNGK